MLNLTNSNKKSQQLGGEETRLCAGGVLPWHSEAGVGPLIRP